MTPLEVAASSLYIVLKDHKCAEAVSLTQESYRKGSILNPF